MFILYGVIAGIAIGLVAGGRPGGLADIRIRWMPLIFIGFLTQILLFSDFVAERIGVAGPFLYVGSTLLVVAAIVRNLSLVGFPLVAAGALSNVAAILANGGFMPASPGALSALGKSAPAIYSNSSVVAHPALEPLTDLFALPTWLPFANVFSIGDVLISLGVVVIIVTTMRRTPRRAEPVPTTA